MATCNEENVANNCGQFCRIRTVFQASGKGFHIESYFGPKLIVGLSYNLEKTKVEKVQIIMNF